MNKYLRKIYGISFVLMVFISNGSVIAQDLGANFNENIDKVNPAILTKTNVPWVRGFLNIPALCLNINSSGIVTGVNETAIQNMTRLDNMSTTKTVNNGNVSVKMIFSLKMDFTTNSIGVPAVGTPQMGYVMSAIEKVLNRKNFGANIDILVVGNEPMYETPLADADKYEAFLNLVIDKVDSMRTANNWTYEIYAGSVNKASTNTSNALLLKVMKVAIENPKVVGLDMHEHVTLLSEVESDLRFIRNSYKFSKKMICTEFSVIWLWDAHASDVLGAWGTTNGYSPSSKMYEWLNQVIQKSYSGAPVSSNLFLSYFNSTTWYQLNWFHDFYNIFKKYNFSHLTYGIQNLPVGTVLTSSSVLWTLNFVCNGTYLGVDSNGLGNFNPLVYPAFKTITDSLFAITSGLNNPKAGILAYQISPNPTSTFLQITGSNLTNPVNISLYNLNSQKIYSKVAVLLPYTISLSDNHIGRGIYLMNIQSQEEKNNTLKVIIE